MVRKRSANRALDQTALKHLDPQGQLLVDIEVKRVLKVSAIARAEYDEIKACAYLGFLEAQRRFDPRKGVLFSSFARQRVRGAILDGIAHLSPLGRKSVKAVQRNLKSLEIQNFEDELLQKNQLEKNATSLGSVQIKEEQVHRTENKQQKLRDKDKNFIDSVSPSFTESYRSLYFQALNFWVDSLSDVLASDPAIPYEDQVDRNATTRRLSVAFESLSSEQQQLIIAVYDLRRVGDSATKYAERMKVHRSTVSRKHAAAIHHLRMVIEKI